MADQKITALTELTTPADGDFLPIVDVSDTTQAGSGTTKKIKKSNLGDASPLTTKGDLYTYSTDNARLPVGTNGQVLKADSGETTGLKWEHPDWTSMNALTYVSTDDPTGVVYESGDVTSIRCVGQRIRFVNGGNTIYGIVTAVSTYDSGNDRTTITFLHEIDPTDSEALHLMANSAITIPVYSGLKAPFDFPLESEKWTVFATMSSNNAQNSPTQNTWYNLGGSLSLPIGSWELLYQSLIYGYKASATNVSILATLSTANNSESDSRYTVRGFTNGASGTIEYLYPAFRQNPVSVTSKTTYYLNVKTDTASANQISVRGDVSPSRVSAVCVYL